MKLGHIKVLHPDSCRHICEFVNIFVCESITVIMKVIGNLQPFYSARDFLRNFIDNKICFRLSS
jgi:hypothetical protein